MCFYSLLTRGLQRKWHLVKRHNQKQHSDDTLQPNNSPNIPWIADVPEDKRAVVDKKHFAV